MSQHEPARDGIVPIVPLPPKAETINIRVAAEDLERWRATSDAQAMTLSDWIRRTCNANAHSYLNSTPAVPLPKKPAKKGGR